MSRKRDGRKRIDLGPRWKVAGAAALAAVGAVVELEAELLHSVTARLLAAIPVAAIAIAGVLLRRWLSDAEDPAVTPGKPAGHSGAANAVPAMLPPRLPAFVGRAEELEILSRRHADGRADASRQGPLKLLIQGAPGVGKSALAVELAYRLRYQYPDGQLFAQMGDASRRYNAGEVLGPLLRRLGREELPTATEDRTRLFRSATAGKSFLIVLDGARDEDQVSDVLPNEARCALIITSRRNLGPQLDERPMWLDEIPAFQAVDIIRAYLLPEDNPSADVLALVAELCARTPMALRSAGERARRAPGGLTWLARSLQEPGTRLKILAESGRDLGGRIAIEYDRLLTSEQRALAMLTLLKTTTFVPWALQSLLDIGPDEASKLITSLRSAGLIRVFALDSAGFARYGLNPLIRLFVSSRRAELMSAADEAAAVERLRRATVACCARILQILDRIPLAESALSVPDHWLPDIFQWDRQVAEDVAFWVASEFGNLIDSIRFAHESGQLQVCWRIVRRIGELATPLVSAGDIDAAFELALDAATSDGGPGAVIEVHIAYGAQLIASGRCDQADLVLADAVRLARDAENPLSLAIALRSLGYLWQRLGDYRQAIGYLSEALDLLPATLYPAEAHLINVMIADNQAVTDPVHRRIDIQATAVRQQPTYLAPCVLELIAYADCAGRRQLWSAAESFLDDAAALGDGDEGLKAYIECRRADLFTLHALADGERRRDLAELAIGHAAHAMALYRSLRHNDGELRARTLLAGAYLAAGSFRECLDQAGRAWNYITGLPAASRHYIRPVCGQLHWIQGEARVRSGECALAVAELSKAIEIFASCGDPWQQIRAQLAQGTAHRMLGEYSRSLALLYSARVTVEDSGDEDLLAHVASEIAETRKLEAPLARS